jgi:hypothetical protein
MVEASRVFGAISQWPDNTDVYLFLEPIHPFEADDAIVLEELRQSVQYWQEAMQQ